MSKETSKPTGDNTGFALTGINYRLILISIAILVVGYILMSGGGTDNPNEFAGDTLFNFQRITLAPLIVLFGYAFLFYAIMRKPKD